MFDPTIHSTSPTNQALLVSLNRDREIPVAPRRRSRSGLRVVEAAVGRFPNGEATMNSTITDKLKSKRPRKFARGPQSEPGGTNHQPSHDATDSAASPQPEPKPRSKANLLLDLLARSEGAT